MKKRMLLLATMLVMTFTATFANTNNPVPEAIVKEVSQQFSNASEVKWSATAHYYKANLNIQGKYLDLYYNLDGSFIGASRNISTDQLPLTLLKDVQHNKANFYVADLFELATIKGGTEYYITYKNGQETRVYRGDTSGWKQYSSTANN